MDSAWASEHLQVIRTLMERSAVYRRALGPIMVLTGSIGVAAAAGGLALKIAEPRAFLEYWIGVSLIAGLGALLLVRRQAWKEREEFWSQPTRQVTQAMLPPMGAGLLLGLIVLYRLKSGNMELRSLPWTLWVPQAWVVLHGCALHAAGFFMPRGIKLFGWGLIAGGCATFAIHIPDGLPPYVAPHMVMGSFFGLLHLAYGVYLHSTERNGAPP